MWLNDCMGNLSEIINQCTLCFYAFSQIIYILICTVHHLIKLPEVNFYCTHVITMTIFCYLLPNNNIFYYVFQWSVFALGPYYVHYKNMKQASSVYLYVPSTNVTIGNLYELKQVAQNHTHFTHGVSTWKYAAQALFKLVKYKHWNIPRA